LKEKQTLSKKNFIEQENFGHIEAVANLGVNGFVTF
jgi:nitrogen regulatory protein PII-like uncharacterized protein